MTTAQDPFNTDEAAAAQFLGGGSTLAAKFPSIGSSVEGTVTGYRVQDQTDTETGEVLFWENKRPTPQSKLKFPQTAKPCKQLLIDLQGEPTGIKHVWDAINERFDEEPYADDDGMRTLYVKGRLQQSLAQTLKENGLRVPEIGSYLKVTRTANVKSNVQGKAYTYRVDYTKASQNDKAAAAVLDADPFAS